MGKRTGFRFISSVTLLFIIAVMCVMLFYTCSTQVSVAEDAEPETTIITIPEIQEVPVISEPIEVEGPSESEPIESSEPIVIVEPIETIEIPQPEIPQASEIEAAPEIEAEAEIETEVEIVYVDPDYFGVPEAPDLDWFTYTDFVTAPAYDASAYLFGQEIDWSEFVFSDEEIVLPDGTYYASLFVNDTQFGSIEFLQLDGIPRFRKSALETELNGTLAADYYYIFFQGEDDYYTQEYLESVAERVSYDSNALTIKLYFNSSQVPVQTLSVGSSSYSLLRQNYDVVGNVTVEPADFSWQSNISAYLSAQYDNNLVFSSLNATVSTSNAFSFWNMTFNMPISVSYSKVIGLTPSVGSWSGYLDFPNENLRLSFGNVGNSGFSEGSPFGITLEKNYGFGTGTAMTNQFAQTITLAEDSTVVIKINGSVVFTKTLSLGVYRLTDFAFVQGSNDIEVTIHPVSMGADTSSDEVLHFGQNYDSSLVAKGESLWRFGVSIPKVSRNTGSASYDEFGFAVPALPDFSTSYGVIHKENLYKLSSLSVFWEQTVGLSHEYSQTHSFTFVFERNNSDSVAPGEYTATFGATVSGTLATKIGTTRATVNTVLSSGNNARNSLSINLSQGFTKNILKPLSLSGTYSLSSDVQTIALNTGYSFNIDITRIGLSFGSSYKFAMPGADEVVNPLSANASLSLSTRFGKNTSFSLSSSVDQDLKVYATASLSFSIGKTQSVNTSASSSNFKTPVGSIGWYYRPSTTSRSSYQVSMSNINFSDVTSHSLSATWSRSGDFVGMSLRTQASNMYSRFMTTLSLNTALAFADGAFAMANSMYGPFLIIDPQGALKDARISVSSATDSSTSASAKTFGNVIYTRLSMYKPNNVVVYASNGSLFSSSGSFLFKLTPVARQGFRVKIDLESSIAVSGVLRRNEHEVYDSYSSPIYKVQLAENGIDVQSLEIDASSYFFTDVDGRFILSDLKSGVYMFDLESNGQWYAAFFEVPESDRSGYVALYKDFNATEIEEGEVMQRYNVKAFDASYAGSVFIGLDSYITESEYWDLLFSLADAGYDDGWDWDIDEDEDLYSNSQVISNEAL